MTLSRSSLSKLAKYYGDDSTVIPYAPAASTNVGVEMPPAGYQAPATSGESPAPATSGEKSGFMKFLENTQAVSGITNLLGAGVNVGSQIATAVEKGQGGGGGGTIPKGGGGQPVPSPAGSGKILGMSTPVFFAGALVLVLVAGAGIYLATSGNSNSPAPAAK